MDGTGLLVSDLDGTLLGDEAALQRFADWFRANGGRFRLVYNSGRLFESIAAVVGSTSLPPPEAVICAVGTEIRRFDDGRRLSGWPLSGNHWDADAVREVLGEYDRLSPQPDDVQTAHKVSCYGHDLSPDFLRLLERRLEAASLHVEIVYSSRRDLDVLPAGTNKGTAAARLAETWKISPGRVIVAGDTGNDLTMFDHGFRGVVVGNAHAELQMLAGENVYCAAATHADGVLEGLRYWLGRPESQTGAAATPSRRSTPGRVAGRGRL